jgi:two-component system, cell cycle sensor histidine kinase and response regulator CckA
MAKPLKVLMLEDNPNDVELVLRQLRHDGYDPQWERVETREDYTARLSPDLDLILSDYQLPQFNGMEALEILKARGIDVPFILVSGTIGEDLAVQAMRSGATDYLLKDRLTRLGPAVEHGLEEARLRKEQRRSVEDLKLFRSIVDHSNDALEVIDPVSGRYLDVNEKGCKDLGYTRAEFLALTVYDIDPAIGVDGWARSLARIRAEGSNSGESLHRRKDGSTFPVEFSAKLVALDREYLVAVVRDVSERKEMESRFFRAQRMEAIGSLASGIAHDINNILVPILMSAPLLRMGLNEEETVMTLDSIESSAKRGSELVKQLLTFGRGVEGARLVIRPDLLVREMASIARQTFPKNIRVVENAPETLPPIIGDSTQLHQVLLNLGVNARDAMPNGGELTIAASELILDADEARAMPGARPGPYVMIRVTDTGMGISPEIINKIFDPFFTTKKTGEGTGLGLSTVIGIVKSHGGVISVKSEVGVGTTFEVWLPASVAAPGAPAPGRLASAPRGKGELIMVVDDEENIRLVLRDLLVRYGYRVVLASNGAEAAAAYGKQTNDIRVVITDLDMPVMNGVELVKELKRMNPGVPMVVSSGIASMKGMEHRTEELEMLGVNLILKKPYPVEEVLVALQRLCAGGAPG